jgi:hypothetical protein
MVIWVAQVGRTYVVLRQPPPGRGADLLSRWIPGTTLRALGTEEGVSPERIRQLMVKEAPEVLLRRGNQEYRWHPPLRLPRSELTRAVLDVACQWEEGGWRQGWLWDPDTR